MKYLYLLLTTLLILACGTLPTAATIPLQATQRVSTASATPIQEKVSAATRTSVLPVFGCWNIRSGAGVAYPSVAVQCGGSVTFVHWSDNGFLHIDGGYICNQAVDGKDRCE
jgi:hypothetical protein